MMLVEHILPTARKRLVTVEGDAPILQAAALLSVPHVSLVIVCDAGGAAIGVISKADIVRQMSRCEGHACKIGTASVMTRNIVACSCRDWLSDVWSTMKQTGIRQIPILDDASKPLGIVYAIDAAPCLVNGSAGSTTIAERLRDVRRISLIFRIRMREPRNQAAGRLDLSAVSLAVVIINAECA